MAAAAEPGRALKLVLDALERADAREVLAAAVGDLVACGAWALAGNIDGRHRANAPQPLLAPCNRRPPAHEPLASVDALLREAPRTKAGGVSGRDVGAFADHVAEQDGAARAVIERTLDALVAQELVTRGEAYALGAFRGVRHARTGSGDALRARALPEHPRPATIARTIAEDELTRALARGEKGRRGSTPDSSGGSNTGAAIRYGGGL